MVHGVREMKAKIGFRLIFVLAYKTTTRSETTKELMCDETSPFRKSTFDRFVTQTAGDMLLAALTAVSCLQEALPTE